MSKKSEGRDATYYGASEIDIATAIEVAKLSWYGRRHISPHFLGDPGIGKTEIAYQAAETLSEEVGERFDVTVVELAYKDQFDLVGLPNIVTKETERGQLKMTEFVPPADLPRSGHGVLLLDEFTGALPEVQRAVMNFILNKRIGEYALPKDWSIMLASNVGELFDTNDAQDPALISRNQWFRVKTSAPSWLAWYRERPDRSEAVLKFIENNSSKLYDKDSMQNHMCFANPRAWVKIGHMLKVCRDRGRDILDPVVVSMIASYIGVGEASVFCDYVKNKLKSVRVEDVLYSYQKVRAEVLAMQEGSDISSVANLCKSLAAVFAERGADDAEYALMLPNIMMYLKDLHDERFMAQLQELSDLSRSNPKYEGMVQKLFEDMSTLDADLCAKAGEILVKLDG